MSSRSPSSRRSKERSSRRSPSPRDNDRYKQRSSYVNNRPQSNYHRNNQWQPRNNNGGGGYNNYYQRNRWQGNYRGRGYSRPYNNYNRGGGNNNYRNNQSHSQSYNRHRRTRSRGSRSRSRSRSYSRSRSRGRSYSKSRSRSYSSRSRSGSRVSKSNRSRSGSPAAITSKPAGLEALAYFRGNSYSGDSDTGKNGGKTSSSTEAVQSKTDKDNTSNKLEESALASVERHRNNLTEMIKQQANTKSSLTYQEAVKESGDKTAKSKQIKTFSINSSINKTQLVTRLYSSSDENSENEATKRKILPKRRRLEDSNRVIEIHDDDGERQHVESTKHRGGGGGGPSNTSHTSDKNSSSTATATSVEPKSQAKEDDSAAAAAATSKLLSQLGGLKVVGPDGKPMNLIAVTVPDGDGKMMQVLQIPATIDQPLPSSTARHGASGEKIASSSDRMEVDNTGDGQKEMGEKRKPWSNTVVTYPGNYMSEGGVNAGAGDTQGYNYTSNAPDYNDPGSTQFGFQTTKKAVDKTSSRNDDDFTDPKYVAATPAASQNLTNETTKTGESDEKKSKNKSIRHSSSEESSTDEMRNTKHNASVVRKEISADEEDNEDYLDLGKGKKKKKKSKKNKRAASSDGGGKDKKKKKKKKSKKSGVDEEKLSGYEEFKLKHEQAGRREDTLKRDLPATLPLAHIRGVLIRKSDEGKVSLFNHVLDKKKQKEAVVRTVEEQFVSLFADETDQKEEEEEEPVEKLDMSLRALRKLQLHLPTPRKVNHRTEITINNRLENMMTETQKKKKKSALKEQIVQQVSVNLAGLSKSAKKRKKSKTRSPSPAEVVVKVDSSGKRGYRERVVRSSSSSSASQSPSPPPRSKRHRHSRSKSRSLPQAYKRSDGGNDKQDGSDDERYRRDGSSSRSRSRDRERSSGGGNNRLASYNNQQTYQSRNFYNNNSNRYQRGRGNYNNNFNNRGNFRGRFNNNNNYRGGYNNHRGGYNNNRGGGYNNNRGGSYFNQYYNNNSNRNQQQQGQNDWRTSRRDDNHREHERHRSTRDNRSDSREADRYSSGGESEHENRSSIQKSNKETNKKEAPIVILSSPEHSSKEQAVDASVRLKKMNEPWTHDMYEEQEAEANRD